MSKIQWTGKTWNVVTGCEKVSAGCTHCYAERMSVRLEAMGSPKYQGITENGRWTGKVRCHPEMLDRVPKADHVFVCSMSDLFHPDVPFHFIMQVFDVIAERPDQVFQLLTKRPERALELARQMYDDNMKPVQKWYDNLWLGTSVEDQETANERIPELLQTPATVHFVSYEPALAAVDFTPYLPLREQGICVTCHSSIDAPEAIGVQCRDCAHEGRGSLDQVIVGGESGPGARPMHPDWARSVRDQCQAAGVAFFFKQWGAFKWEPREWGPNGEPWAHKNEWFHRRVGKKAAGRVLDGRTWDEMPAVDGQGG